MRRYLKDTKDYGLIFKKGGNNDLETFTDADWAGDKSDRKSTTGYLRCLFYDISICEALWEDVEESTGIVGGEGGGGGGGGKGDEGRSSLPANVAICVASAANVVSTLLILLRFAVFSYPSWASSSE